MLEFPYMEVPARRDVTFRPIIPLFIKGPTASRIIDVLVDTGADSVLAPTALALKLGIELGDDAEGYTRSVSGDVIPYFMGPVILELRAQEQIVEWSAQIAFAENPARNLFGRLGGLEFFHAHFLGPERWLMLDAQANLPFVT